MLKKLITLILIVFVIINSGFCNNKYNYSPPAFLKNYNKYSIEKINYFNKGVLISNVHQVTDLQNVLNEKLEIVLNNNQIHFLFYYKIVLLFLVIILIGAGFYIVRLRNSIKSQSIQIKFQSDIAQQITRWHGTAESRFQSVFDSSHDAILILYKSRIIDFNKKAEEIFAVQQHELINKTPFDYSPLIQPDGEPSYQTASKYISEAISNNFIVIEWQHQKKNGELFLAEVTLSSFVFEDETFLTAIIRDITQLRIEQEELYQYRLHLEELVLEKTRDLEEFNTELQASNEELINTNERFEEEINQHNQTRVIKEILEEKLKHFISQSSDGIQILNQNGIIEEWNNSMVEMTGIKREEAIGCNIWDIEFESIIDEKRTSEKFEKIKNETLKYLNNIENEKNLILEGIFQHKNLNKKYVQTTIFPIITDNGYYVGRISRDITQKKAIELELENYKVELENQLAKNTEELIQLSDRFNEVYKNTTDAIIFIDISEDAEELTVFDMNLASQKLLEIKGVLYHKGISIEEIINKKELQDLKSSCLYKILRGENVIIEKSEIINNQEFFWQNTFIPIKNSDGRIRRLASFTKNITKEKENQKNLAKLSTAINSWPYDFWLCDKNGRIIIQNSYSTQNWGNRVGEYFIDLEFPVKEKDEIINEINNVLNGQSMSIESTYSVKGFFKHMLVILNPIKLSDGQVDGFVNIVIDISERKNAEEALKKSELKYRELVEHANSIILRWTPEGIITFLNDYGLKFFGYTESEIVGKQIIGSIVPEVDDSGRNLKTLMAEITADPSKYAHNINQNICKDGKLAWIDWTNKILLDDNGQIKELFSIGSDITERKRLEQELLNSVINTEERERLRFSQELHDGLGPIISAAKLYTQWLNKPNANIEKTEIIFDIEKLLNEAAQTIRDISFNISPLILQSFGITEAIQAFSEKVKKSVNVNIEINSPNALKLNNITETIIYRILCECINNTVKHANASIIKINFEIIENSLIIRYTDNGQGFDINKILSMRKGIGLLNMQSRLKSINGNFEIQSSNENGTEIIIAVSIA